MTDTTCTPDSNTNSEPIAFDDRTRRVMELRKQVREGTYRPDPQEVATAMLREWATVGELVTGEPLAPSVHTPQGRREFGVRFTVESTVPEATEVAAVMSA